MKRYEKFVLEAEQGINFGVSEETSGELIIKALKIDEVVTKCSENYTNPPIPDGYLYVCGHWNNGFVIERDYDGSQFVWIPVGWLDANGTLNEVYFRDRFGRRNYKFDTFSNRGYHEPLDDELLKQFRSVKKYGGFYISRYNISKGADGKPQSIKGMIPWIGINFYDAKKVASTFENEDDKAVKSHLPFGAEYDCVLEWFIKSEARTFDEIANDSTFWGNYRNLLNSQEAVVKTGFCTEWNTNNIYDFAGNVKEWTQERREHSYRVIRGGNFENRGSNAPVATRSYWDPSRYYLNAGFRTALYIK